MIAHTGTTRVSRSTTSTSSSTPASSWSTSSSDPIFITLAQLRWDRLVAW
jgi:hypothetical protein